MQKLFFFLFFAVCLVFASQQAFAVSLSSNGDVHTVTQRNLTFVTDPSGLVKVFKNGDYLASIGFTLKGTVNSQQKFLNSWSTDWTWQVLSNTDSNVTILGSTDWQGLEWKQRWLWGEDENGEQIQKFTNYATNNTGFDSTNTSFYYVVRFDSVNVPCLDYTDNTGVKKNYCFENDKTITQNLGQYLKRISFVDTLFDFQDLIDSGFEFNYLYAGQLGNVNPSLAGQGFIIGVTKNGGLFPNGTSVILDPTIKTGLTDTANADIFDPGSPNVFRVNATSLGFIANATDGAFFSRYYESVDNGLNWSEADFNFYTGGAEDSPGIVFNTSNNKVVLVNVFNTELFAQEGDFDNNLLTRADWDNNVGLGFTGSINPQGHAIDINSGNFLHVCGGPVNQRDIECRYVDTDLNTADISNWSALESSFSLSGNLAAMDYYIDSSDNGILLYSAADGTAFVSMKVRYDVNGSWSNDLNLTADLDSAKAWSITGNQIVETLDGNLVVLLTTTAATSEVVLRFCDDGAEACVSNINNWDTYRDVYDANFLFGANLSTDTNGNILVTGTDCSDALCNTNQGAQGLNYRIFFDLNKTISAKFDVNASDSNSVIDSTRFTVTANSDTNGLIDLVYFIGNSDFGTGSLEYFEIFGDSNSSIISASFTTNPVSPIALDPEEGIANVQADFNSTSQFFPNGRIVDINYLWLVDGEEISTNENTVWDFNGADSDTNVTLIVSGNDEVDTLTSQNDQNILLRSAPQGIDINFSYNNFANNVDMNFGVTATGTINFAVWGGTDFDVNSVGTDINKTYLTDGIKQVCVIVNGAGDINKLHCENFTSTRVLVKRPKDKVTDIILTPFDVATNDITRQLYSAQTLDLNVFLFFESGNDQNVLFTIDGNADYFSSTFLIQTNDVNTFRTIQPLLVLVSESVSSVFHVINAITQNTIPDVVIESRQGGVLIESTITDSTGSATLNFIVADTYNLTFIFQGVVSLEQEIRPIDTEYFIYLFLEEIITAPQDPETITVTFDPSIGQVQEGTDGNFTLTQIVSATRASITLINIQVDQNGTLFFDTNFIGVPSGGTFSQDLNASMFVADTPIGVTVTITSSLIDETKKSISYFIQFTSQVTFLNAINDLGLNLGAVGRIVLVVLSSFVIIGGFAQATRNPNILGGIVLLWVGAFTAIGLNENYVVWVPVPVFLFALIGAVTIYLNR